MKKPSTFIISFALTILLVIAAGCGSAPPTVFSDEPVASPPPPVAPSLVPSPTPITITATPASAFTSLDPDSGMIVFVSNSDIFVMNEDGSDWVNLTRSDLVGDNSPAWSPDGTKIAFVSVRDLSPNLYIMSSDGSGEIMLTRNSEKNMFVGGQPDWSPDGRKIAYEFCNGDHYDECDIYLVNENGSGRTKLTYNKNHDGGPSWSPDGERIVFESNRDGNSEIYVMNVDGSQQIRLTKNNPSDYSPAWSPDGTLIAYTSCRTNESDSCEIYVMNGDGSGPTRLTNNNTWECCAAWSPDGSKIIFVSDRDAPLVNVQFDIFSRDGSDLYVMNVNGSNPIRLTDKSEAYNTSPSWSPSSHYKITQHPDCTSSWTRLKAGSVARVSRETITPNRVRSGPSQGDEMIVLIHPGTIVKVIEGPVCTDGLVFWKVEHTLIPGGAGWTAEGDGQDYWLEPYSQ